MKWMFRISLSLCLIEFLLFPTLASARVGVGVGLGKIEVDKPLKAGAIYDLPDLPVLNTGDESAFYNITVQYHENIPEMWPERSWFRFEPQSFDLEKGGVKQVKVTLVLPPKIQPGKYFAYLEASPSQKADVGETTVGIAAASKLYFTVEPSSIFQGFYYRFVSLYSRYHPWDTIAIAVLAGFFLLRFIGKHFKIQIAKK